MILAAGLGTRLRPLTDNCPKALVKFAGKTLLEHAIRRLMPLNVERLVINVHHYAEKIEHFLEAQEYFGLDIRISDERDRLLNTGGGVKQAASLFLPNTPVLIYNVDIFSAMNLEGMVETHAKTNALATLAVRNRETKRYLLFDSDSQLCGWKNIGSGEVKKVRFDFVQANALAFSGIHIVSPEIFPMINENGAFSIIDLYLRLAKNYSVLAYEDESKIWIDLGKPGQLEKAESWLRKQKV